MRKDVRRRAQKDVALRKLELPLRPENAESGTEFVARIATMDRKKREEEAAQMQNTTVDESDWDRMAPLLDEAIGQLAEKDRSALALRFFEHGRHVLK